MTSHTLRFLGWAFVATAFMTGGCASRGTLVSEELSSHDIWVSGDFDGQGKFDHAVGTWLTSDLEIILHSEHDTRVIRTQLCKPCPVAVAPVDIDGDGVCEIAVSGSRSRCIDIYRINQTKTECIFDRSVSIPGIIDCSQLVPVDLDADGRTELVTVASVSGEPLLDNVEEALYLVSFADSACDYPAPAPIVMGTLGVARKPWEIEWSRGEDGRVSTLTLFQPYPDGIKRTWDCSLLNGMSVGVVAETLNSSDTR